jgi:hypothetical protein
MRDAHEWGIQGGFVGRLSVLKEVRLFRTCLLAEEAHPSP